MISKNALLMEIRSTMGDRERRIFNATDAIIKRAGGYPGCIKISTNSFDGDNTFIVRLSDFAIIG